MILFSISVCLYMLFYATMLTTGSKTVAVSSVTPDLFKELIVEYGQSLSCPCETITIPYKNLLFNNVAMHPVCSSVFVDEKWIEGLYFANASLYGVWDFRTTAFHQVCLENEEFEIMQVTRIGESSIFIIVFAKALPYLQVNLRFLT